MMELIINMQTKHLYDYTDYKLYLNDRLDSSSDGRGSRSSLARAIRCQTAYVSSALRGHAHFTPEQGEYINEYLGHTDSESDFFMLLLQHQRAGTENLRRRLKKQMDKISSTRFDIKKRLSAGFEMSSEEHAQFYSEWYFAAIHALVSIPGYQAVQSIANYMSLDIKTVAKIVDFLLTTGLLEQSKEGLKIGNARTHLGADSPFISKHHINWRLLAMQKVASNRGDNLHYSSVITLSEDDATKIKEMLVASIKNAKSIVRDSKEETLQCFSIDFFKI